MRSILVRFISIFIILGLCHTVVVAGNYLDDEKMQILSINNSIFYLSQFDIVRNPTEKWNEGDFISRRNAFEMLYIVYKGGSREIASKNTYPYESILYDDVEYDTYDYYLCVSLTDENGLMLGNFDANGNRTADLDFNITYYEALTGISRLFEYHEGFMNHVKELKTGINMRYPYYNFCEELGLINSSNMYSSLNVDVQMLNQPITAYEFMHLLHNALYIPTVKSSCYGGLYSFRYIDCFMELSEEVEVRKEDIDSDVFNVIES